MLCNGVFAVCSLLLSGFYELFEFIFINYHIG